MKFYKIIVLLFGSLIFGFGICFGAKENSDSLRPPYLIDYNELKQTVKSYREKKEPIFTFGNNAILEADKWLDSSYSTIVNKLNIPTSGDKHDYYSIGPYWWPDSTKKNGLPYIRKDGYRNPELLDYDKPQLSNMTEAVKSLTLAYILTKKIKYKDKALGFLKTWFIDLDTKMNPHLEYGQAIPGITDGRGIGIIETRRLVDVVDAIGILYREEVLDSTVYYHLKMWFKDYTEWLITSEKGLDEKDWYNNHGTTYDLQVLSFSLFIGDTLTARTILDSVVAKRIIKQIEPDGKQPHELARTKSMSYSILNLKSFVGIALLAEKLDFNLWDFESFDGRSINGAINYLTPFLFDGKEWRYPEMRTFSDLKVDFLPIINITQRRNNKVISDGILKSYDKNNYEVQKEMLIRPNKFLF